MKLVFGVFLIALILFFCGCINDNPTQPPVQTVNYFKDAVLNPTITGCASAEIAKSADISRMPAPRDDFVEKEPKITVDGNSVIYSRAINHQCCRELEITKEFFPENVATETEIPAQKQNDTILSQEEMLMLPSIKIFENWTGEGCKCICSSEITTKIDNLWKQYYGPYNVIVFEKGINPDGTAMEEKILIQRIVNNQPTS